MSKPQKILLFIVLLLLILFLIFFRWESGSADELIYEQEIEITIDSSQLSAILADGMEYYESEELYGSVNVRRRCKRGLFGERYGTYYGTAKCYWKPSGRPFKCKYIRLEHSIYGNSKEEEVSEISLFPQQRRHCRAHHLKAYFNPYGYYEALVENGQN